MKKNFRLKQTLALLLLLLVCCSAEASAKKPKEIKPLLLTLQKGESHQVAEAPKGQWASQNEEVASVTADGQITAQADGFTKITCTDEGGTLRSLCEVKVGQTETPAAIRKAVDTAIEQWQLADGARFERFNQYTKWYRPTAHLGFGWCGAFVSFNFDAAGIPMEETFKQKDISPLPNGDPFAVRQAAVPKLYEGFLYRNRIAHLPEEGYYVIYGKKSSTPFIHVGLVTRVVPLENGQYLLETVEGNMGSRIKRFSYVYDSLAKKAENNLRRLPKEQQTQTDVFDYQYVQDFYIYAFGQTWY